MDIFIVITVILFISLYTIHTYSTKNNAKMINTLLRQTARWATASQQDTNPFIANLHSNYAQAYYMALTDLYSEIEIFIASGIDSKELSKKISYIQDTSMMKLAGICPEGKPKDEFLVSIAKQGQR